MRCFSTVLFLVAMVQNTQAAEPLAVFQFAGNAEDSAVGPRSRPIRVGSGVALGQGYAFFDGQPKASLDHGNGAEHELRLPDRRETVAEANRKILAKIPKAEAVPTYLNPELIHASVENNVREKYMAISPSLCELLDGTLMIAYHRTSGVDWLGAYSTWVRTSKDGGRTWGEPRLIAERVQAPGLLRLRSGDLLLNGGEMLAERSTTMRLFRSKDGGRTWVEQRPIWEKSSGIRLQGGCGSLLQLKSGRILCPMFGSSGGNYDPGLKAWCYYSDDDGKTWTGGRGKVELPKRGAMEPSVAELKDGTLVMALRTQLGSLYLARSQDSGETWSQAKSSGLEAPEAPFGMASFPDSGDLLLVYNSSKFEPNHHHSGERTPLTAAVSRDGGKTWRIVGNIVGGNHEIGAAGSNSICFTCDGKVVMAYDWLLIPWDRQIKTGGTWVAIADKQWFYRNPAKDQ